MIESIKDCVTLNNGVKMPWLGLGVWQVNDPDELDGAVRAAINCGYMSIDTAAAYGNEREVGQAIRASGVPRESLFITTKLWNAQQVKGYEASLAAFETSRTLLGLDYLDLYLIHWPVPRKMKYVEAWKALINLQQEGLARAIGVCNFHIHHLAELEQETGIIPAVNQVELHPWLNQRPLVEYCRSKGIQVEAYSPLLSGHLREVKELAPIAARYRKTPAQVVLRWDLQNGVVCIPKSVHANRIQENAGIFDFVLSAEDMAAIDALDRGHRFLPDPDAMNFYR